MKINISTIFAAIALLLAGCTGEDLPKANFDLHQVKSVSATAGDAQVTVAWVKADNAQPTEYLLSWTSAVAGVAGGNQTFGADKSRATITGLKNGAKYTFSVQARYANGLSNKVSASCTPVDPRIPVTQLFAEPGDGKVNLTWKVPVGAAHTGYTISVVPGDKNITLNDASLSGHNVDGLTNGTEYTFTVVAVYAKGASAGVTTTATPLLTQGVPTWESIQLNYQGLTGYVKTSNPAFSPDGKTMYVPTSTPAGHLFAIDVMQGKIKWVYQIEGKTYGGGPLVASDGTVYQCGEDMFVYAINPDGTSRWKKDLSGKMGAFPAISATGTLYCATNGANNKLFALKAADGTELWSKALDGGTASAILVGKTGDIFVGTYGGVFAFGNDGTAKWNKPEYAVTERGAFAARGTTLYAALRADGGVVALDMANGNQLWQHNMATKGDCYFPIVDAAGVVYVSQKATNKVYAINADGTQKWAAAVEKSIIYSGLVLGDNGVLYLGTHKAPAFVLGLNSANGAKVFETEVAGAQIMAAVTLGPDKRLYVGTIGADNIGSVVAFDVKAGANNAGGAWAMRGGDLQGTNGQR